MFRRVYGSIQFGHPAARPIESDRAQFGLHFAGQLLTKCFRPIWRLIDDRQANQFGLAQLRAVGRADLNRDLTIFNVSVGRRLAAQRLQTTANHIWISGDLQDRFLGRLHIVQRSKMARAILATNHFVAQMENLRRAPLLRTQRRVSCRQGEKGNGRQDQQPAIFAQRLNPAAQAACGINSPLGWRI